MTRALLPTVFCDGRQTRRPSVFSQTLSSVGQVVGLDGSTSVGPTTTAWEWIGRPGYRVSFGVFTVSSGSPVWGRCVPGVLGTTSDAGGVTTGLRSDSH